MHAAHAALMANANAAIVEPDANWEAEQLQHQQQQPQQPPAEQAEGDAADTAAAASSESALSNPFLVQKIFTCLNVKDLCSAAAVCNLWNHVSASEDFWRSVSFEGRGINRTQVIALLQRHTNIQELNLKGVAPGYANESFFRAVLPRLQQLRTLTVHKEALTESCLVVLGANLPSLQQLTLDDVGLGASRFNVATNNESVLLTHQSLLEAAVLGCRVTGRLTVRCEQLQILSLAGSLVTQLQPLCPQLRSLDISGCTKLTDVGLRSILSKLDGLTQFKMEGGVPVSDDTLREMARTLPSLSHLNIAKCTAVTLSGVRNFNSLTSLDMSCCDALAPATAMPALQSFISLQRLVLDGCALLTSLLLSLPRLRMLSARGCRALAEVELRCRSLVEVAVGPGPNGAPGCAALRRVTLASDAMTSLEWHSFPALDTLTLDCPQLKELAFADCDGLRDWTIGSLGDRAVPVIVHGAGGAGGGAVAVGIGGVFQGGDAGVPRLERLRVEGCEGLRRLALCHTGLQALTISNCKHLASISLSATHLTSLCLEECGELQHATLLHISVPALSMGACSALMRLELASDTVTALDLRGCGCLCSLELDCPALQSLDAKFCGELSDSCIQEALVNAPPLKSLVLSVCPLVGDRGLAALEVLSGLVSLDLSYTEVQDLAPVYEACPQLQTLNLCSCRCLRDDALAALLLPQAPALPHLRKLDASYCTLPPAIVVALLRQSTRLEVLALNGCDGVTDKVWKELNCTGESRKAAGLKAAKDEHERLLPAAQWSATRQQQEQQQQDGDVSIDCSGGQLQSLSLVRCTHLKSLCLGLVPAAGTQVRVLDARCYLLASHQPSELSAGDECHVWELAATPLAGLRSLRLGLSGVQVLVLALPQLENLDLSRCTQLRVMELRCPLLLTLHMQACKALPMQQLAPSLASCSALEMLDLQHTSNDSQLLAQVRAQHDSLCNLLTCQRGCGVCRHQR